MVKIDGKEVIFSTWLTLGRESQATVSVPGFQRKFTLIVVKNATGDDVGENDVKDFVMGADFSTIDLPFMERKTSSIHEAIIGTDNAHKISALIVRQFMGDKMLVLFELHRHPLE